MAMLGLAVLNDNDERRIVDDLDRTSSIDGVVIRIVAGLNALPLRW